MPGEPVQRAETVSQKATEVFFSFNTPSRQKVVKKRVRSGDGPDYFALHPPKSVRRKTATTAPVAASPVRRRAPERSSVTMQECLDELVAHGGPAIQRLASRWATSPRFRVVRPFVRSMEHRALYAQSLDEVTAAINETEHALGDRRARVIKGHFKAKYVEDMNPPFATQHIMHMLMEKLGRFPLWQDVQPFLTDEAPELFYQPMKDGLSWHNFSKIQKEEVIEVFWWRMGKAYYSFLREMDFLFRLRDVHGLDAKYHVFADVTLRADTWVGMVALELFMASRVFKDVEFKRGRKQEAGDLYKHGEMEALRLYIPPADKYGQVSLFPERTIEMVAEDLRDMHKTKWGIDL